MTKQQKEEIKQRNMLDRDRFDSQNLGGFRRSFPNPDSVSDFVRQFTIIHDELPRNFNKSNILLSKRSIGPVNEVRVLPGRVEGTLE